MTKRRTARDEAVLVDRRSPHDLSPVALIGCDSSGRVTSWNRAASNLLGWRNADAVGRRVVDLFGRDVLGAAAGRVHTQALTSFGSRIDVDLLTDGSPLASELTDTVFAAIPTDRATVRSASDSSPGIQSWGEAARAINEIGGTVQCFAVGLIGVTAINRGYSRSTGDAVLREVEQRLGRLAGPLGRAIRIAGTQFLVVAPESHRLASESVVHEMSTSITTDLGQVRIGTCVGVATGDAISAYVLLDRSESAMRLATSRGVGAIERSPGAWAAADSRHPRLSSLLIDAVARREIGVQFQPVVDLTTGAIIEFEALARWRSGELGDVDPNLFIEAAEDAGLIHELGRCVVDAALDVVVTERMAGRWTDQRVSVNLSAAQLAHPDLVSRLDRALSKRSLTGAVLQIELTETRPVPADGPAATHLAALRLLGVRVAVDDFGTGCANLSYLRDFPVDAIKIDRRFIEGISTSRADAAVVRSIISVASDLKIDVIAEGVETPAQHLALMRLGCPAAQGFLYASPRSVDDLHLPVSVPTFATSSSIPVPVDEAGRLRALYSADVLEAASDEEYDDIVRGAAALCDVPMAMVGLIDSETYWVKGRVGVSAERIPREFTFCAHTICQDGVIEVTDTRLDARFADNPAVTGEMGVRFYAGASLHGSSGHNYGALCVMDVVPRTLDDIQRAGLARLARRATVLIDIRRQTKDAQRSSIQLEVAAADFAALEQNHKRDATIDTLTGLANRASLLDTLEITIKLSGDDDRVTLFLCDVDHFATVNDTVGHVIGDQVLREVAARIDECVRSTESVGRLGDDQFAVVMGSCESSTIDALANRIMQRVAKPMTLPSGEHFVPSVSIGVASGRHGQDADSLMRSGRAALSAAKQRGGGQVHVMGVDEVPGDTLAV